VVCWLIVWSVLVYAHTATASTITIDSFNYPNDPSGTEFYVPGKAPWGSGNPFDHKDPGVLEVIGNERDTHVEVVGTPMTISASGIIGYEPLYDNGVLWLSTGGPAGTFVRVVYDGADGLGLGGIDLTDGGSNNLFRFGFVGEFDPGGSTSLALTITVDGQGGGSTSVQTQIPDQPAPFDFDVPFADFSNPGLLSSVKSITCTLNDPLAPVSGVDFELDYIKAVPEPSTIALLSALGASLLLAGILPAKAMRPGSASLGLVGSNSSGIFRVIPGT
jgi:hypothetical protein